MFIDRFGRTVSDLRISVIDKCNFRCTYCMPAEGLQWLKKDALLTTDEIERVARIFVLNGLTSIKVTGGEPTVRAELVEVVSRLRAIDPALDLSMTTNGYLLDRLAGPLREAGLDRITVSCDSLLRHRFAEMTRRDALDQVMAGLDAVTRAGFSETKVNCVVIGGTNDDEVVAFAELARRTGHEIRFIEFMPLDAEEHWTKGQVVSSNNIRRSIDRVHPLVANGNGGPAKRYRFADGAPGGIGFISSVSEPFCASCDRVRLTADGQLRACLFSIDEVDLRTSLRDGSQDASIEHQIAGCVENKWAGHRINESDFVRPARSMSQIGG
ncbi:MAG: GTP 3',8-cyclase MoaA [Actinomycetota bacterium]